MKEVKERVSITIDHALLKRLKRVAEEEERSLSQMICFILKRYMNENDQHPMR